MDHIVFNQLPAGVSRLLQSLCFDLSTAHHVVLAASDVNSLSSCIAHGALANGIAPSFPNIENRSANPNSILSKRTKGSSLHVDHIAEAGTIHGIYVR